MATIIIATFVLMILFIIIYACVGTCVGNRKITQLHRYWHIKIGMPEDEMLSIMGTGYNRSLLKNSRVKYEWRINASSYGSSYKGISTRTYTGIKKVTIYIKDGYVEEVKPYNV